MKPLLQTFVTVIVISILSGCSTIVFTNDTESSMEQYGQWHHNVAYSLYELSPPVQPNDFCKTGWSEVKVEKDVVTAIAGSIDSAVSFGFADIWDPWAVTISCAR